MKNTLIPLIFLVIIVLFAGNGYSQDELNLGTINFPKDFIHSGKDYSKGTYKVSIITKEGVLFFQVSGQKGEFLFSEMAVIKDTKKRNLRKPGIRKTFLKDRSDPKEKKYLEYFRLTVYRSQGLIAAFFLLKKEEAK